MSAQTRAGAAWFVGGLVAGFVAGAVASYAALWFLFNRRVEWHAVLYGDAALALILVVVAVRHIQRAALGLVPGLLFGIAFAIAACWILLFWVVGI